MNHDGKILIAMIVGMLFLQSCSNPCTIWTEKGALAFKKEKSNYFNNIAMYKDLALELARVLKSGYDSSRFRPDASWDVDSLDQVSDKPARSILSKLKTNGSFNSLLIWNDNRVDFYSTDNIVIEGESPGCPGFQYVVSYIKNDLPPLTESLNYQWYKIDTCWYVVASVNSL